LIEGVADVFQLAVEVVAVAVEPVLEALEQVGREVRAVERGVAVRGDGLQALLDERVVTRGEQVKPRSSSQVAAR